MLFDFRDKLVGVVCIMVIEYLIDMVIWLKLCNVLFDYLDFCVELLVDYGLLNIVEECYDIGVWYGD